MIVDLAAMGGGTMYADDKGSQYKRSVTMKQRVFSLIMVPFLSVAGALPVHADAQRPPDTVVWDGKSPMTPGVIYKLPGCDNSTDANAPCYVSVTRTIRRMPQPRSAVLASGSDRIDTYFAQSAQKRCVRLEAL